MLPRDARQTWYIENILKFEKNSERILCRREINRVTSICRRPDNARHALNHMQRQESVCISVLVVTLQILLVTIVYQKWNMLLNTLLLTPRWYFIIHLPTLSIIMPQNNDGNIPNYVIGTNFFTKTATKILIWLIILKHYHKYLKHLITDRR